MHRGLIAGLVVGGLMILIVPRRRLYLTWGRFANLLKKAIGRPGTKSNKYTGSGSELDQAFVKAGQIVGQARALSNEQQLQFYSDTNRPKPSAINMIEVRKWEAWKERAGLPKDEAKRKYIDLQKELVPEETVQRSRGNGNEEDDLFMSDEEYQRSKSVKRTSMSGIVMSKPSMISEDIGQIEGADAYSIIEDDVRAFFKAVDEEDITTLQSMIDQGFDLGRFNDTGATALHYAVDNEKEAAFTYLIEKFDSCDVKDVNGDTPLHYATNLEAEIFIEKLLAKGANPKFENKAGETPESLASSSLQHLFTSV